MHNTAYVYKWTHLPTLKWYIGSRYASNAHPDDGYICTSSIVKPLIIAKPKEWIKEIVDVGTPDDMRNLEAEILYLFDAKNNPQSYNQHNGDGKFRYKGGIKRTEENKRKISESLKGVNTWAKGKPNLKNRVKGRHKHSEEWKQWASERQRGEKNAMFGRYGKDNPNYGSKRSEKTKQNMRGIKKPPIAKISCIICHHTTTVTSIKRHIFYKHKNG